MYIAILLQCDLLSHHQINLLLKLVGTDAETYSQTMCRVIVHGIFITKWYVSIISISQRSRNLTEEEGDSVFETEGIEHQEYSLPNIAQQTYMYT